MIGINKLVTDWEKFFETRKDPVCKSQVGGNWEMSRLFLKTAKRYGAKKGRFCADGSVMVYFEDVTDE